VTEGRDPLRINLGESLTDYSKCASVLSGSWDRQ
jgi:hypothetical protein